MNGVDILIQALPLIVREHPWVSIAPVGVYHRHGWQVLCRYLTFQDEPQGLKLSGPF